MDETIRAIGYITKFEYHSFITVKKIRKFNQIEASDYSKINFYWRSLQALEDDGIIKRFGSKSPKKYCVLDYYKFFNLLHDVYVDQANIPENSD
ncbi:MAG: hypothetical protein ACFE9S_19250 [Candidatus Hermodarchaeota archaeon]